MSFIFGRANWTTKTEKEAIIQFYKAQYLKFMKIGEGGLTEYNTLVTSRLIKATANRLDQLIKGKITDQNRNRGYFERYTKPRKYDSNRSFGWNNTSHFRYSDLTIEQKQSIEYPITIIPTYIDKYTTAYISTKEIE
jgi:hypothetical protein